MATVFSLVGLFPPLSAVAPENQVKIEITHSHANGHHHHHHNVRSNDEDHQSLASDSIEQTAQQKEDETSNQHSHELVVSSGHVFTISDKVSIVDRCDFEKVFPNLLEKLPPNSRYPGSIFRPPIHA